MYCRKMRKIFHFTQVLIIWKKHRRLLLVSMSPGGRVWNSSTVLWPIFLLMEITEADRENFCIATHPHAFSTMYKNFFIIISLYMISHKAATTKEERNISYAKMIEVIYFMMEIFSNSIWKVMKGVGLMPNIF